MSSETIRTHLAAIAQAAAEKNKKSITEVANGTKVEQAQKPTVPEVIVISSDEEYVEVKEKQVVKRRKLREKSTRRNAKTSSSVISARRKEASCGIVLKDLVVNIDTADKDNELAVTEYVDDIYAFYKLSEVDVRVHDCMASQPDITAKRRSILVDWWNDVHRTFKLMPETFYLTLNIVDRFLSTKAVPIEEIQLVGISSMLIASKYEAKGAPEVNDFVWISDYAYVREQVLAMERTILRNLKWNLAVPTPYVFLVRYIKASTPADKDMENMANFLAELSMMHYATVSLYSPSMIAASSVYAARSTLKRSPFWTNSLKHYTGYSEEQVRGCAKLMVSFHSAAPISKLRAIYKKYCNIDRCAVALMTPAKNLSSWC